MKQKFKFADEQSEFIFECLEKWAWGEKEEHIAELSLRSYWKATNKQLKDVVFSDNAKALVLFGNGAIANQICKVFRTLGWPIQYYTTNNPSHQVFFNGIPYISPKDIGEDVEKFRFIIGTSIPSYIEQISKQLAGLGVCANDIIFTCKDFGEQYFNLPELNFNENEVFVDAGSFNGDDALRFVAAVGGRYDKIYSFEPDAESHDNCKQSLKNLLNTQLINAGLWDATKTISFASLSTGSSHVLGDAGNGVQVYALDDYLKNERVTYIKMDIEGAELQALKGAKNTIVNHRPKLAICVYHKPQDIYEIPAYIAEIAPFYKMYLRHYSIGELETVLYAIPTDETGNAT